MILILSFTLGLLSLAIEILWIRFFSIANHSVATAFCFVIVFYLIGIALGAKLGKLLSLMRINLWQVMAIILITSSVVDFITPWVYAATIETAWQLYIAGFCILATALVKASIFPISHYLAIANYSQKIGRLVAKVYAANVFGATIGPVFSMVLLSYCSLQQSFMLCACLTLCMGALLLSNKLLVKITATFIGAVLVAGVWMYLDPHYLLKKILIKGSLLKVIENQYGVVATYAGGKEGDYVTGGNVYDGRTNLDPLINSNGIHRVLVLATLVDRPTKILVIGLSIGSWLKLVTSFPHVTEIDVVEINPSYLQLIQDYPAQAKALKDKRVKLHIADARRWLKLHPDRKYDIIIENSTYHWRGYAGHLLSVEFLRELKTHLKQNGVLGYNPTESLHVLKTAASTFKHAYLYDRFVIAGDFDWRVKLKTKTAYHRLASLRIDGQPLLNNHHDLIDVWLNAKIYSLFDLQGALNMLGIVPEIITDTNLITEFKYGHVLEHVS